MKGIAVDVLALGAQGVAFLLGLVISLVIGMYLAAHLDGPGGLLVATVISGAGLLMAAVASQSLHDYLVRREG